MILNSDPVSQDGALFSAFCHILLPKPVLPTLLTICLFLLDQFCPRPYGWTEKRLKFYGTFGSKRGEYIELGFYY